MADMTSTRRGILGAMALAPVVLAAPAAATTNSDFALKLAAADAAERVSSDYAQNVYNPAHYRFWEAEAAVPHTTVRWNGEEWSTAHAKHVKDARYVCDPRHKVAVRAEQQDYYEACLALMTAADERDAIVATHRAKLDDVTATHDALVDAFADARDDLILCPVSSARDLARKLAYINKHGGWDLDGTQEAITADVARVAA